MNRGFGETLIGIGLVFMLFALALSLIGCAPQRRMDWGAVAEAYERSQKP